MHEQILKFLTELRNASPLIPTIFLNGSCYRLFLILKTVFPCENWLAFYDNDYHVWSYANGRFYDINGEGVIEKALLLTDGDHETQQGYVCNLEFSAINYGTTDKTA